MESWASSSTDKLCEALLTLETKEECYRFLEDICTVREILDISQRLSVAMFLSDRVSYSEIKSQTGASTTTIGRVNKCYEYGSGGYKLVIDRMEGKEND